MSLPATIALPPKPRRRWLSFSLRSLLILTTLVCVGIVGKQQYDWYRKRQLIHQWIAPLLPLIEAAGGDIGRYPDNEPVLITPPGLTADEELAVLVFGILELESSSERFAALKVLVDSRGVDSFPILRNLVVKARHRDLQALLLHLIAVEQNPTDVPLLEQYLESPSAEVRAAAAETLGYLKDPTYPYAGDPFGSGLRSNTIPPIHLYYLMPGFPASLAAPMLEQERQSKITPQLRSRLEAVMLRGATQEERTAAARALVAWPPEKYSLRFAEWGVWIDDQGKRLVTKGVLEEIPPFVHATGNSLASLKRNRDRSVIIDITKPIIHLTANCPLAVDLEVSIVGGRPWYAFPRPDVLTVHRTNVALERELAPSDWNEVEPANLSALKDLSEGYPWIHPEDRGPGLNLPSDDSNSWISAVGLRWQSLIVSPDRESWTSVADVPADTRFRWWESLRDVPSCWVTSQGETERFLYYDGPTTAHSPVKASLQGEKLTLLAQDLFSADVRSLQDRDCLFIDASRTPRRATRILISSTVGKQESVDLTEVSWLTSDDIESSLADLLQERGLTKDEANGLLDSWRERFFQTSGKRLLSLLTPAEYDRMCPLTVRPAPTEAVRVGIVLTEF